MRKDFKNLDIYAAFQPVNGAVWQKANGIHADWKTPDHADKEEARQHSPSVPFPQGLLLYKQASPQCVPWRI